MKFRKNILVGCLLTLLCAQAIWAAIAFDAVGENAAATTTVTTASFTVSASATVMIINSMVSDALVGGTTDTLSSAPKWNSSSTGVTQIGSNSSSTTTYHIGTQRYYLLTPASGSHTASCDSYSSTNYYHSCVGLSITGADGTTPVRSSNQNYVNDGTGSTAPTVSCSSAQSGDLMVLFLGQVSSTGSFATITAAPGTLQSTGTGTTGIKVWVYTDVASGSYTANWTISALRDYGAVCIDIAPAASGTTPTLTLLKVGH